jgi:glycosyltransferase involved in cell wall biosynthesis
VRICLVYETLYPYFRGGADRWYRNLAERLAAEGLDVTYLTLRRWDAGAEPDLPGVRVVTVGPALPLYAGGRRRASTTLRFGAAVSAHLLRHGDRYDVVHTAALQLTSLGAAAARRRHRFRLVVDWFEVWTRAYWLAYLGPALGRIAWSAQQVSLRTDHEAICFSRLHERRLREGGFRGRITRVGGIYAGPLDPPKLHPPEPVAVFLGRHIPEKRVRAVVPAVARARERAPELRAQIFGDGPERAAVLEQIGELHLDGAVEAPGVVPEEEVQATLDRALCLLHPSEREGYGLVVVEAAAAGTPVVLAAAEDNAATELVDEGVNGFVAPSASPDDLADAILRVRDGGEALRASTAAWFAANAPRLSIAASLEQVLAVYRA